MLDVIQLLGEKSTRDELGLGGVRDAFADLLFPGTSTVQTVAKYFLFVPWIYLLQEQKRDVNSMNIIWRARNMEIELAKQLELSGETDGVIGRIAKENLQRLPSNVYWQGLYQWGIRRYVGSQDEYHRSLDSFHLRKRTQHAGRDGHEGETADEAELHHWHVGLPSIQQGFPVGATLALSPEEAEYLRERILTTCSQSLLAYLLREHLDVADAEYVWHLIAELPPHFQSVVRHGQNFSECMHGAQLLYNLMLAELTNWQEGIDKYRKALADWWQVVYARMTALHSWDRQDFWKVVYQNNPRVSSRARQFIDLWIELVLNAADASAIIDAKLARQLVEQREVQLKGGLARMTNQRARELWNGAAGTAQMDLRWRSARRIVVDILSGLEVAGYA
jgi:hypothetical protein